MKELKGSRTLIAGIIGMVCLVIGLWLIKEDQRGAAYTFFAAGIGCIIGALTVKSVGTAAVEGNGLTRGFKNLVGPSKPGDPP